MIALGPVTSSAGTTYTSTQVQGILLGPSLTMRWWFDLLGPQLQYKADLTASVDSERPPTIDYDSTRAVKRFLRLQLRSTSTANVLRDLVRVRYEALAPDGGWLAWIIGLFMLTPPASKEIHEAYTWWDITAPDLSQLLADSAFAGAYAVSASTSYAAAIRTIVANYGGPTPLDASILDQGATLPAALGWNAGDSRLKAVNDLLAAVNYVPAWMAASTLTSKPQPDYAQAVPSLVLDTIAGQAQIVGPLREAADYTNAFNQILVTGQDPRRAVVSGYYENRHADSPISLTNWHPRLKAINDSSLVDDGTCTARAITEAQASARIYSVLTVGTVPFPFFEDLDVITLAYQSTDEGVVRNNYVVVKGVHTCSASTPTVGSLQRIVAA